MQIPYGNTNFTINQGRELKTSTLVWDSRYVVNGHTLIMGYSGTGKTHTLRHMIRCMARSYSPSLRTPQPLRIHVFDVHDDIEPPREVSCSELILSESSGFGLNPLIVEPNIHSGGVRKSIQNFINIINKTSRQLGERQESVLRGLMTDLYYINGFKAQDSGTWTLSGGDYFGKQKKFPTVKDLYNFCTSKYKYMTLGGDRDSTSHLEKLNREIAALLKQALDESTVKDAMVSEKFQALQKEAIQTYTSYVKSIKSGRELANYLRYDSRATIKSVADRIGNLNDCGIFSDSGLPFDDDKTVWRYRIKHLGEEEKRMFVFFRLKELYDSALRRGVQDTICEVIFIDEAKKFMDDDPDNIIVKMVNEIRKFGTMIVCASQSFNHFSDDFMTSTATKIILGVSDMDIEKTAKKVQLKKEHLMSIRPKQIALIQIKQNLPPEHPLANAQGHWQPTFLRSD